jgi:hypothetical protein
MSDKPADPEPQSTTENVIPPIEYEERIVAFLDILGWRDLIEKSNLDPSLISKMGSALNYLRMVHELPPSIEDWVREKTEAAGKTFDPQEGRLQFAQFSDCIVISGTTDLTIPLLFDVHGLIKALYYHHGLVIRGAVTGGKMFHKGSVAFGPAITAAYDMERLSVSTPRVIIDPKFSIISNITTVDNSAYSPFGNWFRKSSDGMWFFDYLYPLMASFDDSLEESTRYILQTQFINPNLNYSYKLISDELSGSVGNPRKREKYIWLAEYFNEVIRDFPAANILPIRIE